MGVRRSRRPRGCGLRLGRRLRAGLTSSRQHVAGGVSVAGPAPRWLSRHIAGWRISAKRIRLVRHGRQCMGMDQRFLYAASS
jgi:hypothetical protein